MKVYSLKRDSNRYSALTLPDTVSGAPFDILKFSALFYHNKPISDTWTSLQVDFLDDGLIPGDYPGFAAPVISERAVAALSPVLEDSGELLPMKCGQAIMYAYKCLNFIDALNEEDSTLVYWPGPKRKLRRIAKYAFCPEAIEGQYVFRIPQEPLLSIFVTCRFVERVREHDLQGFTFPLLWSSDAADR